MRDTLTLFEKFLARGREALYLVNDKALNFCRNLFANKQSFTIPTFALYTIACFKSIDSITKGH